MRELKIARATRDPLHLPVLLRKLWRDHLHPRRQGQERHSRRSSTSKAIRTIRSTAARSVPRAPRSSRTSEPAAPDEVRRCGAPGSDHWEDIGWDTALDEVGHWVKKTRDASFVDKDDKGKTVNRCEGLAWIGGCTDYQRVQTSWSSSRCAAWGSATWKIRPESDTAPRSQVWRPSFGRGAMTKWLHRHQEHRHDVDHGWQSCREPPVPASSGRSKRRRSVTPR